MIKRRINKDGKEVLYIYSRVRQQSLRVGTINGEKHRGKKGVITVPIEFIGKEVKVSFERRKYDKKDKLTIR